MSVTWDPIFKQVNQTLDNSNKKDNRRVKQNQFVPLEVKGGGVGW